MKKFKYSDISGALNAVRVLGLDQLLKVKKAKETSEKFLVGFFATRVINTLYNVGFFDELMHGKAVNIELFAKDKGLDKDILCLLCDYLFVLRVLEKDGPRYRFASGDPLVPEVSRGLYDIVYAFEEIFHNLEPLLRKEKVVGKDVRLRVGYEAKGTGQAARFLPFPIMIDYINKNKMRSVLDLGCGSAIFLIQLCQSNPEVNGYGMDLSRETLSSARKLISEHGLQERITLFKGNVFNLIRMKERKLDDIEIITASFLLHELFFRKKEVLVDFLCRLRKRFKNKPLMVCENFHLSLEELKKNPGLYAELQLAHALSHERQMTRGEWISVLRKSGFKNIEERTLGFAKIGIFIAY